MKKIIIGIIIFIMLLVAHNTKPDDKTCIIKAIKEVWGDKTPDEKKFPHYFEQFMDLTSTSIEVNDWIFLKRIRYIKKDDKQTIGFGMFNRVIIF